LWAEQRKRGTGVSVKLGRKATSAESYSEKQRVLDLRRSEPRASPSSLTEKQRVLVGLAEEARHETSLGDCSEEARDVSWGFYFEKSLRF